MCSCLDFAWGSPAPKSQHQKPLGVPRIPKFSAGPAATPIPGALGALGLGGGRSRSHFPCVIGIPRLEPQGAMDHRGGKLAETQGLLSGLLCAVRLLHLYRKPQKMRPQKGGGHPVPS